MNEDITQKFGFSEMYEWAEVPEAKLGRFVQFSEAAPGKVVLYGENDDPSCSPIVGVTTVNSAADSDDPEQWKYAYMCNEYGDMYLRTEKLAVGQKMYDELNELNYIKTYPWEHYVPIPNKYWRPDVKYVKRSSRQEWAKVNVLGKAIVYDGGTCKAGEYCMPYQGKIKGKFGSAVPADDTATAKYYVIERFSESTILILNKNVK